MTDSTYDENSAVLAEMAAQGDDLSRAREIEFAHVFAEAAAPDAFREWAESKGYFAHAEVREDGLVDVIVGWVMVPDVDALTELELQLAGAARRCGGKSDGWGCFALPKLHA